MIYTFQIMTSNTYFRLATEVHAKTIPQLNERVKIKIECNAHMLGETYIFARTPPVVGAKPQTISSGVVTRDLKLELSSETI